MTPANPGTPADPGPLAVYLHWPYCARICPYCDFNVYRDRREGEGEALVAAMVRDLEHWRDWTGPREVGSVHFGGGTPSLLTGAQLNALIGAVARLWELPETAEVALEANPNAVTAEKVADWSDAGLNRLSLGVQSFDDDVLRRLGRDHDGGQAVTAVERCVAAFRSVSADLIFGVAGEGERRLDADLDRLLALGVPHISAYQLTVEPGTSFAKAEARGERQVWGEAASAEGFERIHERLTGAGFRHYEVSNYARPGHESRHNLAYWRGRDYVGVGPGAHGRLWTREGRVATETALRPADYIRRVEQTGTAITERDALSADEAAEEHVMMGLRIADGLSLSRLAAIRGTPADIDPGLFEDGLLERDGDTLKATAGGRLVLDALTRAVLLG